MELVFRARSLEDFPPGWCSASCSIFGEAMLFISSVAQSLRLSLQYPSSELVEMHVRRKRARCLRE